MLPPRLGRVVSYDKGKSLEMALPLNIDDLIHQRKVEGARIEADRIQEGLES